MVKLLPIASESLLIYSPPPCPRRGMGLFKDGGIIAWFAYEELTALYAKLQLCMV